MTITDDTFVLIREEHPDLDAEIRGILIARAQTGATIGQIKDDYRKMTGTNFPVHDHITEFLLCIPGVMAICNERGTRIFSVQPTDKTKHIYDLVMNQRPASDRWCSTYNNNRRQSIPFHSQYNSVRPMVPPLNLQSPNMPPQNFPPLNFPPPNQPLSPAPAPWRNHFSQPINPPQPQQQYPHYFYPQPNMVQHNVYSDSDGHMNQSYGTYQDNCQHLYNRFHNGNEQNIANDSFSTSDMNTHFQNLNIHRSVTPFNNNINHNRMSLPCPEQQNVNEDDVFKRPIGRAVRTAQSSSPTGTRNSQTTDSLFSSIDMENEAHLFDFPLLGDDFFLHLARLELKCRYRKRDKVYQSGLCISGQTIKAATKRISELPFNNLSNRRIIINIGSVDIMQGKTLVQIEHDYRGLIKMITKRGMQPILTTLAPLANYSHDTSVKTKLERFNEFIKREGKNLLVIDIWARFVNEKKQTLFDCYQSEPRYVAGARESYVFWNNIGRQRVLQEIESKLEY